MSYFDPTIIEMKLILIDENYTFDYKFEILKKLIKAEKDEKRLILAKKGL